MYSVSPARSIYILLFTTAGLHPSLPSPSPSPPFSHLAPSPSFHSLACRWPCFTTTQSSHYSGSLVNKP